MLVASSMQYISMCGPLMGWGWGGGVFGRFPGISSIEFYFSVVFSNILSILDLYRTAST